MLAGVKIIPREEAHGEDSDGSGKDRNYSRKGKNKMKKKSSMYSSSDDEVEKIKKGSRKEKFYSSESMASSEEDEKKQRKKKKNMKYKDDRAKAKKKSRRKRKHYLSDNYSSDSDETYEERHRHKTGIKKHKDSSREGSGKEDMDDGGRKAKLDVERKSMGLEWMLRPKDSEGTKSAVVNDPQPEEFQIEEVERMHPRELNPYLKDNGSGYPEDEEKIKVDGDKRLTSFGVGDGGASWRLKALKRAQEQAAREGRRLEEVAGERWGSLGQLAVSVSSGEAAPFRAHLHAINHRRRAQVDDHQTVPENQDKRDNDRSTNRDYLKNVSLRHPDMKAPKARDTLSWGKKRGQPISSKDADLVSAAVSSLNKFENDGSFLKDFENEQKSNHNSSSVSSCAHLNKYAELKLDATEMSKQSEVSTPTVKQPMSANQLAAKVMQHRLKGRHREADDLLKEANDSIEQTSDVGTSRFPMQKMSVRRREDDGDMLLAQKIVQNKKFSISGQADDEYDFEDGPRRKNRQKGDKDDRNSAVQNNFTKRILTQQERCHFCFENPKRPRHLAVSIANFTYLMLPQGQPVVPGHCCILPMQHESSTRVVDNNVWEEIRNFKKQLIKMFAEQKKDVVFLETVMGLAQQQRHCMIECIPLPQPISEEAPMYFKQAIDEAESEWSQHNAKKLIDTSKKGLRGSIPKDFPYFHVEFGLDKGYAHVIDDEQQFKSSFGFNVIRGMLKLPEEDMYRRRRYESIDAQKKAVASFAQEWEQFDWTKEL